MSIVVYTGKPGSGKSYRVVHELLRDEGRYYVFHNIDGLKEVLIEDGRYIEDWRAIDGFLTKAKQESLSAAVRERYGRSMLVIVDEAQMVMADKNSEIKGWLSWHRHLGQDIKIICQHYKMISPDLYNLADYEIRGKRGFVTSQFVYQWCVNGEVFKTDRIKRSDATFAAYRSFVGQEVTKGRSKLLALAAGCCVVAMAMGIYTIGWGLPTTFQNEKKRVANNTSSRSPDGVMQKKKDIVKKETSSEVTLLQKLQSYSYAGCVGGDVLLQSTSDLSLTRLSEVANYRLLEANRNGARIMIPKMGIIWLGVKNSRYQVAEKLPARATVHPDLARAGGEG